MKETQKGKSSLARGNEEKTRGRSTVRISSKKQQKGKEKKKLTLMALSIRRKRLGTPLHRRTRIPRGEAIHETKKKGMVTNANKQKTRSHRESDTPK